MALKNWKTESALSSIQISSPSQEKWVQSEFFPGIYVYNDTDLSVDPITLFDGDLLMVRGDIDETKKMFGQNGGLHNLALNQWDWILNEMAFLPLTLSDSKQGRWGSYDPGTGAVTNIYQYNNWTVGAYDPGAEGGTGYLSAKPTQLVRSGRMLHDVTATKTDPSQLVDGEWMWFNHPVFGTNTVFIYNAVDPDIPNVDNLIKYNNGAVPKTIYIRLTNDIDPNTKTITKPGETIALVPEVASGKRVIVTSMVLFNGDKNLDSVVSLEVANVDGTKVTFWEDTIPSRKSIFIDSVVALNAGDRINIYADNSNVRGVATGDIN